MSISDRYRELVNDVKALSGKLQGLDEELAAQVLKPVNQAMEGLRELQESVGEIPRIRLEADLTPVLLKAHGRLDRARLLLEEQGAEDRAAAVWEMEQKIYRLLNDL
jgi:hypothetical protein